jgi:hypothetical protein
MGMTFSYKTISTLLILLESYNMNPKSSTFIDGATFHHM